MVLEWGVTQHLGIPPYCLQVALFPLIHVFRRPKYLLRHVSTGADVVPTLECYRAIRGLPALYCNSLRFYNATATTYIAIMQDPLYNNRVTSGFMDPKLD